MAYYQDVKFLNDVVPALVERNADEFKRAHDLLESVEHPVRRTKDDTDWEGAGRDKYDDRLDEVSGLVTGLKTGFGRARTALDEYAVELAKAQNLVEEGQVAERKLAAKIDEVATAVTRTAQKAEPMHQWEDIRTTTGILDWIAELGMDVDSVREDAERFYEQARNKFEEAKVTEETARKKCLDDLKLAYDGLPDFRADSKDAAAIVAGVHEITTETQQAVGTPNVALAGAGPKTNVSSFDPNATESPTLKHFRELANRLPAGTNTPYWTNEGSAEFRAQWIKDNKQAIIVAAKEAGLPPDLVAGIAWQEVGGKGRVWDDVTQNLRDAADSDWSPVTPENLPDRAGGAPDEVSYGPLSIQVRRAAEVLGYDPENLSDQQRDEVIAASEEPRTNILISAQHLADLKAQSGFADVPAEQMTPEQYAELGARYNGGPSWDTNPDAQAYGRTLNENLPNAKKAMQ